MIGELGLALALLLPVTQDRCDEPTYSPWAHNTSVSGEFEPIDPSRIFVVRTELDAAVELLAEVSAFPLTPEQAGQLAGEQPLPALRDGEAHYLVRAVFPVRNPYLSVGWYGDTLAVSASGLGCAPYYEQPLIVPLDRAPAEVDVWGAAAL